MWAQLRDNAVTDKTLNYWHYSASGALSLDPRTSDSYLNFTMLYQIVGTLLRNGKDGIYEPFLAESWRVQDEGKVYTFKIHSGLTTQNNQVINAEEYAKVFHFLAKYLTADGNDSLVQFDRIKGMKDYLSGKASKIEGVFVDMNKNEISFHFEEPPDDVLIAFTEPFFGFYNLNDFDGYRGLKDQRMIDSSGIFAIEQFSADGRAIRLKRQRRGSGSFQFIQMNLFAQTNEFLDLKQKDLLVYGLKDIQSDWQKDFAFSKADPNMLGAITLSPFLPPFNDIKVRQAIRDAVNHAVDQFEIESPRASKGKAFNFLSIPTNPPWEEKKISENFQRFEINQPIPIVFFNLFNSERNFFNQVFKEVYNLTGVQLVLKELDRAAEGEFKRFVSDKVYPARITTVVVGGTASNQNNKLMFCSDLGVSFKNPNKKICDLISDYELKSGLVDQSYIDQFSELLWDEAIVLPVLKMGFMWMHSKHLDTEVLKSGLGMPRLDLL